MSKSEFGKPRYFIKEINEERILAGGLFIILDDIAAMFDDVALMSKVAAKKTAALLGDDLAVNAEKATGFHASRELPVIWAITKGSFINKLIILPIAFLLSTYTPWLIVPVLLVGGGYLSYEGVEKIYEWITGNASKRVTARTFSNSDEMLQHETVKIKAAIRTDFILSLEIVFIALETVMQQSLPVQVMVVGFIALLATVGVYGVVALMVRMDDAGIHLIERAGSIKSLTANAQRYSGKVLVASLPELIRLLSVVGTIAMLLVGGGMYVHNIAVVHSVLQGIPSMLASLLVGVLIGAVLLLLRQLSGLLMRKNAV